VNAETLCTLGIALIIAGMTIMVIAVLSLFFSGTKREGKVKGGGVIIVGPFPIVFGTDKKTVKTLLLLSLALTILLIILMIIFYFLFR
jgi:uncharacterized protein (TIGR00304 family)